MAQSNTVLVVDDEKKIVEVLKAYFEKEGFEVACAYRGEDALRMMEEVSPALVLLDLMLPDMAGEDICRTIRKKSSVPIIMLTAKVEEENILNGLDIGADDYVLKPFSPRQIVARARAVLRRANAREAAEKECFSFCRGDLLIDIQSHEVKKKGKEVSLTPNEFKILLTLAKHPKKIFTRDELITIALDDEFEGYDRVIDTHIKNIRQKIEDSAKSPRYIATAHGIGYKFGGEADEDL